jgi:ADP-ribose pyrophosphatase
MSGLSLLRETVAYLGYRRILRRVYERREGARVEFDIVDAPSVVTVFALTPTRDTVVCVRQFRPGPGVDLVDLPGGAIEPGETPRDAAARELLEETGYVGLLRPLGVSYVDAYSTGRRYSFVATGCRSFGPPTELDMPSARVVLLAIRDVDALLNSGSLSTAETVLRGLRDAGLWRLGGTC